MTGHRTWSLAPSRALPSSLRELPVDLFIHIDIEGPLYKGQGHFQGLDPQWRTPVSYELQPLNAHQATIAGCILLQVLGGKRKGCVWGGGWYSLSQNTKPSLRPTELTAVPDSGKRPLVWIKDPQIPALHWKAGTQAYPTSDGSWGENR